MKIISERSGNNCVTKIGQNLTKMTITFDLVTQFQ